MLTQEVLKNFTHLKNFTQKLSRESKIVWVQAVTEAQQQKRTVNSAILLVALLKTAKEKVFTFPSKLHALENIDIAELYKIITLHYKYCAVIPDAPQLSVDDTLVLTKALERAKEGLITPFHLLYGIASCVSPVTDLLLKAGCTSALLEYDIFLGESLTDSDSMGVDASDSQLSEDRILSEVCRDMCKQAKEGKFLPLVGRKEVVDQVLQILLRKNKGNPILIGEAGVGKTGIVEGIAQMFVAQNCPLKFQGKRLFELELSSLVAGTRFRGDLEEKLKKVIQCVKNSNGEIILFIDEAHLLIAGGSASGGLDLANMLKPALARGEIRAILATTPKEFRIIERDSAFRRRVSVVDVPESTLEETYEILNGVHRNFALHHGYGITQQALQCATKYSKRYLPELFLPDKAIDLVDQAMAKAVLVSKDGFVEEDDILALISQKTGIPLERLSETEKSKLHALYSRIKSRVCGQETALSALCSAIITSRMELSSPRRPVGSFLFFGPSGVGKTEMAQALAWALYDSDDALKRFDMSEYMEKHSVSRLIGSPVGYVGSTEGGVLTEHVRRRPFSVLLFDEIEKAHRDVLNIFLQMLDAGRLTDGQGKTVDFSHTVIIMTSNAFHESIPLGKSMSGSEKKQFVDAVRLSGMFRVEFLNRFDELLVFSSLTFEQIVEIVRIEFAKIADIVQKSRGISLDITQSAVSWFAQEGWDPVFGARPLRRCMEKHILSNLAMCLLSGSFQQSKKLIVSVSSGEVKGIFFDEAI